MELSDCVFLNILLKTVILNYSTIWLLTPTLSEKLYYNMIVCIMSLSLCLYTRDTPSDATAMQWRRQDFVTGGGVRYGSMGGLEYEVTQSRLYCLCINVALCSTALQCICRVKLPPGGATNHTSTPPLSFFTGWMPFLPPNQQRHSTEGNILVSI